MMDIVKVFIQSYCQLQPLIWRLLKVSLSGDFHSLLWMRKQQEKEKINPTLATAWTRILRYELVGLNGNENNCLSFSCSTCCQVVQMMHSLQSSLSCHSSCHFRMQKTFFLLHTLGQGVTQEPNHFRHKSQGLHAISSTTTYFFLLQKEKPSLGQFLNPLLNSSMSNLTRCY